MGIMEPYRPIAGRFQPGQAANPHGRPIGSRNKFSEQFYVDLARTWQERGADVMERVAATDPATFLRVAASLIPKEVSVALTATLPAGLDSSDWVAIVGLARAIKERLPHMKDLKPEEVCRHVSNALSAYDAIPVIDVTT
jgi:Family of unknown function (DUF5681)